MKQYFSFGVLCACFLITLCMAGCKPEIAIVLDDYCNYHQDCNYITVTQFEHSHSACERFHKDLLNETADGKSSGCGDDVENFFIDFMNAQMELGCDATLMQTLNASPETQQQLSTMLSCVKNSSDDVTTADVADMGLNVVEKLDLDVNHMDKSVCQIIIGIVLDNDEQKINTVCSLDLSKLTVNDCNSMFEFLESTGSFSFGDKAFRERVCGLFTHPDP